MWNTLAYIHTNIHVNIHTCIHTVKIVNNHFYSCIKLIKLSMMIKPVNKQNNFFVCYLIFPFTLSLIIVEFIYHGIIIIGINHLYISVYALYIDRYSKRINLLLSSTFIYLSSPNQNLSTCLLVKIQPSKHSQH